MCSKDLMRIKILDSQSWCFHSSKLLDPRTSKHESLQGLFKILSYKIIFQNILIDKEKHLIDIKINLDYKFKIF